MTKRIRKLYRGDCLDILRDYIEPQSVDLVYLDPPFNSNANYNLPFKGKDKGYEPVEAFVDTWTWTAADDVRLAEFHKMPAPRPTLAMIVELAQRVETGDESRLKRTDSLAAYLLNMADRLLAVRQVMKPTASIYLHCDSYAGHYLKLALDVIIGRENFRNEIAWCYRRLPSKANKWQSTHDTLLFYAMSELTPFNVLKGSPTKGSQKTFESARRRGYNVNNSKRMVTVHDWKKYYAAVDAGVIPNDLSPVEFSGGAPPLRDWWEDIKILGGPKNRERLGYPTQKPLALLERIIKASSNESSLILDPFCGCGTTVHAAEELDRHWIGIDISRFSTELMRERILFNYPARVHETDIDIVGLPESLDDARILASENPFEFEKWVCGRIGVNKMGKRKRPGDMGPDAGIDGEIILPVIRKGVVYEESVVVQVKGGNVTPDSVKALSETVRRVGAVAGVMVCFSNQMGTVENQRSRETWDGGFDKLYPVIQGYSIADLLEDKPLDLPPQYGRKRGGRMSV